MSLESFPNIGQPDWGLQVSPDADVTTLKLGDGYVLRAKPGINHLRDSWSPTWSDITEAQALSTLAWLKARLKLTPFLWSDPQGVQKQVVCQDAKLTYNQFNSMGLSATFEQDFNPV